MKLSARIMLISLSALTFAALSGSAAAETEWQKQHPRRAEVNHRLDHQDKRINRERKEGEINKQQARELHQQDRAIRQQERADARQNHGHITKQEQKTLNQEENTVSKEIGK
ncbi:hypothetical protein [Aquitalea magnusonii]|uniref:Uncharacterized protein n=1 Tax=Aquitalea magnusonii TaxID=332411 RepID=A0A318JGX3_9NEIS|nr:hypothetical protein [Aquitalea magnusonii]PXX48745.1 hypothetical protein DFR38_106121 [Aquitalea magnusonii]